MANSDTAVQSDLVFRTTDGDWYKIPAADLAGYRMSEDEAAKAQEQIPADGDVQGFQAGAGSGSGSTYTLKGVYYWFLGVDPSFANLK